MTHPCPSCRCDDYEPPKPPSTSSPGVRRLAIEQAKAAVRAAKEKGGRL